MNYSPKLNNDNKVCGCKLLKRPRAGNKHSIHFNSYDKRVTNAFTNSVTHVQ